MKCAQHAAHNPKFQKKWDYLKTSPVAAMDRLKDPPTWLKVATTQEIDLQPWAPCQWTSTTTRWWCGLILLPSLTLRSPHPQGESKLSRGTDRHTKLKGQSGDCVLAKISWLHLKMWNQSLPFIGEPVIYCHFSWTLAISVIGKAIRETTESQSITSSLTLSSRKTDFCGIIW